MATKPTYHDFFAEKKSHDSVMCIWNPPQIDQSNLEFHREFEFHYIKRGNGAYFIHNRRYPVAQNHLIIIKSGEIHKFIPPESFSYIEKGSLYFPPSFVDINEKLGQIIKKCPHILRLTEKEATLIEIILKNIDDEINSKADNWDEVVHAEITLFLSIIKRCASRKNVLMPHHSMTEKILTHLEQHYTEDLSLADIARTFSLSMSRISHLFKKETGLGLKHYILQRRIVEAKKLLTENTGMKVSAISAMTGFGNFYLFNRHFKLITGLTPTNYRRISLQGRA